MQAASLSLKSRLLRAGSWSFIGHAASQVIRFVSNVLLAQFLLPDAFGLMSTVTVIAVGLHMFSDLGIVQNVVRHPNGEDRQFLNTAWTLQIVRGIVIWLVAVGVACGLLVAAPLGWVAETYADPRMPWIIIATSFTAVLLGMESTKSLVERRHMRWKRLTQIDLCNQAVGVVITATLAWWTNSIWALVAGNIFVAASKTLLTHLAIEGPRNHLCWDREALKDLVGFGKWVFMSSILFFLAANADRLILPALVSPTIMGLYAIAFTIISAPTQVVATLAGNIALPALSEVLRERAADLRSVTIKFQKLSDYFLMPMAAVVFVAGPSIVNLFYSGSFQDAGTILQILAIGGISYRYGVVEQCYLVMGKPQIFTLINVIRFVGSYVAIPLGFYQGGFDGALIAIVLIQYVGWPIVFYFKIKYQLFDWRSELMAIPLLALGLALGWPIALALDQLAPVVHDNIIPAVRAFVKGGA